MTIFLIIQITSKNFSELMLSSFLKKEDHIQDFLVFKKRFESEIHVELYEPILKAITVPIVDVRFVDLDIIVTEDGLSADSRCA